MGLFDRLFAARGGNTNNGNVPAQPKKEAETFFLDADASSSMGNVEFMRRSNTIRRTFPGTVDSPGNKEMVAEVASMEAKLEKMSEGLGGQTSQQESINLTGGIPKPVKKTFAQTMSQAELDQRMKGTAFGVNVPGGTAAIKKEQEQVQAEPQAQPQISQQPTGKAGAIDPFKQMVRDLNS
ncbi:hypothetical protein KBY65_06490 [Cyanobium sp. Alchichica 3B3-8F6]|uniref:hypothetical protein n=1 Tax=Synechococcales TaxID=1890424 RepID=UPI000B993AD8|nr:MULTISPECIES: hypothetical protein [Synechococcales]MCP9882123.1 hypothetical protein [Cyanobium sp. Alchichica 3B3-8F6]